MQHAFESSLELRSWHFFGLLLAAGAGWWYVGSWLRDRDALRNSISAWRVAAFCGGLLTVWIASATPLAALVHELLTLHMVQHLLLSTVAAPLLLLGEPVQLFARRLPRGGLSNSPAPWFRSGYMRRFVGGLTHPVFCWLAAVGTLLAWHVPRIFELAMHSPGWHALEQFSFLATGILFWWPVIQPWPGTSAWSRWSIPLYLLLATLPCDALSAFLAFCDRVVYPAYLEGPRHFPFSPLQDQECAGALMWVWVTIVYLVPAVAITLQNLAAPLPNAGRERQAT